MVRRYQAPLADCVADLLALTKGWDSYDAEPISPQVMGDVLEFIDQVVIANSVPLPQMVPTNSGGVQVEWHTSGRDIEIEFSTDQPPLVYCDGDHEDWTLDTEHQRSRIREILRSLS